MRVSNAVPLMALALLAAGCGGNASSFRIGVLSDCYGPLSGEHAIVVAAAELPLLARGAKVSRSPLDGVGPVSVAGRHVVLEFGCVAGNADVIPEARRLVEEDGAQAIVGTLDPQQGMVLRAYARRRPETVFLIQPSDSPELTLRDPAPNVFRFAPDSAQEVAGLGSYAYKSLGWRTAATVGDDAPYGWSRVAAFVAEFCALGGRVVDREWFWVGSNTGPAAARGALADGVFFAAALSPARPFLQHFAAARPDVARHLVATSALAGDATAARIAAGAVFAGSLPARPMTATRAYVTAFARAFPALPTAPALSSLVIGYRDGVEAVLEALARAAGDGARMEAALRGLTLQSPLGALRLDGNRQAVVSSYLARLAEPADPVAAIHDVAESFGGLFDDAQPPSGRRTPACVRRRPAPWARLFSPARTK
jgi:branched-chain amino acid transport system substrate-binding protein